MALYLDENGHLSEEPDEELYEVPEWISPEDAEVGERVAKAKAGFEAARPREEGWTGYVARKLPGFGLGISLAESLHLNHATKRIREGTASQQDYDAIAGFLQRREDESERGWLARTGDLAASLPAFAVEFLATGGAFSGARAAVGKGIATAASRRAIPSAALQATEQSAVARGLSATAGAAAHAAANPARLVEAVGQRRLPGSEEEALQQPDEGQLESLVKGTLDHFIEYGTEHSGAVLVKALGLSGLVTRLFRRGVTPSRVSELLSKAGYQGIPEELLEEHAGEVARYATGVEEGAGVVGDTVAGLADIAQGNVREGLGHLGSAAAEEASRAVAFGVFPTAGKAAELTFLKDIRKDKPYVTEEEGRSLGFTEAEMKNRKSRNQALDDRIAALEADMQRASDEARAGRAERMISEVEEELGDARQKRKAAEVHGDVLEPEVAEEGQEQVPADQGGQEVQEEVAVEFDEALDELEGAIDTPIGLDTPPEESGLTIPLENVELDESGMREESAEFLRDQEITEDKGQWQSMPQLLEAEGEITVTDGRHRIREAQRQGKRSILAVKDTWDEEGNVTKREFVQLELPELPAPTEPTAEAAEALPGRKDPWVRQDEEGNWDAGYTAADGLPRTSLRQFATREEAEAWLMRPDKPVSEKVLRQPQVDRLLMLRERHHKARDEFFELADEGGEEADIVRLQEELGQLDQDILEASEGLLGSDDLEDADTFEAVESLLVERQQEAKRLEQEEAERQKKQEEADAERSRKAEAERERRKQEEQAELEESQKLAERLSKPKEIPGNWDKAREQQMRELKESDPAEFRKHASQAAEKRYVEDNYEFREHKSGGRRIFGVVRKNTDVPDVMGGSTKAEATRRILSAADDAVVATYSKRKRLGRKKEELKEPEQEKPSEPERPERPVVRREAGTRPEAGGPQVRPRVLGESKYDPEVPETLYHGTRHQGAISVQGDTVRDGIWLVSTPSRAGDFAAGQPQKAPDRVVEFKPNFTKTARIADQDVGNVSISDLVDQGFDSVFVMDTGFWVALTEDAVQEPAQQEPEADDAPLTAESLQEAFDLTPEQAEAVMALVESMDLDVGKILAAKRGQIPPEALPQISKAAEKMAAEGKKFSTEEEFFAAWDKALRAVKGKRLGLKSTKKAVDEAVADISSWLRDNPQFADYYSKDNAAERAAAAKLYPELKNDAEWAFYKVAGAIASNSTNLSENITEQLDAWGDFRENQQFDVEIGRNERGHPTLKRSAFPLHGGAQAVKAQHYQMLNQLVKQEGSLEGAVKWLVGTVPAAQIRNLPRELGAGPMNGKQAKQVKDVVESAVGSSKEVPRMFVFGPKLGAYAMNHLGRSEYTTVDVWESRFWRSFFKGAPVTGLETDTATSAAFKKAGNAFAQQLGMSPSEAQAVRWYYIIQQINKAGYRKARSNETISAYTKRAVDKRLGEADPQTAGARKAAQRRRGRKSRSLRDLLGETIFLQEGQEEVKGFAQFLGDGRVIIGAVSNPDVSTALHELAHVARRQLLGDTPRADITAKDIETLHQWAGVEDGLWTKAAEEKFARGFERYIRDGQVPTGNPELKNVFQKLAQWLSDIYRSLKGSPLDIEISPEMRKVFDKLVGATITPDQADAVSDAIDDMRRRFGHIETPDQAYGAAGVMWDNNFVGVRDKFDSDEQFRGAVRDAVAKQQSESYPDRVVEAWLSSQQDRSFIERRPTLVQYVRRLAKRLDGWKTADQLTVKDRQGKRDVSRTADTLQELVDLGIVQTAWDSSGVPHYAMPRESVPSDFITDPSEFEQNEQAEQEADQPAMGDHHASIEDLGAPGSKAGLITAEGKSRQVQYVAVEADRLIPSHDARRNFARNEGGDLNERPYHDPKQGASSRRTVEAIAEADPAKIPLLTSDNPTPTDGPPITTDGGVVLGGNARSMGIQLAYHNGGDAAARMKQAMVNAAGKFGIDTAAVEAMESPVIVRILEEAGEPGELSALLNEALTTGRSQATTAVSRGKRISSATATSVSAMLSPNRSGEVPSLREVLSSPPKADKVVQLFLRDGVWADADLDRYIDPDTKALNEDGKLAIEQTLLGRVVDDPTVLGNASRGTRQKTLAAIGPLTRGVSDKQHGARMAEVYRDAVESLPEYKASGAPLKQYFMQQKSLVPFAGQGDAAVAAMVNALDTLGPLKFKRAMNSIIDSLGIDTGEKQAALFGDTAKAVTVDEAIAMELGGPSDESSPDVLYQMAEDNLSDAQKGKVGANLKNNPATVAAAAKLVEKAIAGKMTFDVVLQRVVDRFGEKQAKRLEPVLRQEWDKRTDRRSPPNKPPRPHPELAEKPDIPLTSIKNEVVNELRRLREVGELEGVDPETTEEWLNAAADTLSVDPKAGERLVNELLDKARNLSEREVALLQRHYRQINNDFEAAAERLFDAYAAGDPAATAREKAHTDELLATLTRVEEATKAAGREWGRAGVARQITLAKDFSQAAMVRKAQVANGGKPLSAEQTAEIAQMARQIEDLQKRLAAEQAKVVELERQKKLDEGIQQDIDASKKKKRRKGRKKQAAERVAKAISDFKAKWAAFSQMGAIYDPKGQSQRERELLAAAMEVVKAYANQGYVAFTEFWASVKDDIGSDAEPVFRDAWERSKASGDVVAPELSFEDLGAITKLARQVQRHLVESGITEREEVVDGVHEALQEVLPDITRRQTMDALSGYGQFTPLSKDQISQIIRDINGQLQQLAKLDDMEQGRAPLKTGAERRTPSEAERRLLKLVNEAKKRGGFTATNPDAVLRSAMDAAKTAVKNRIADLTWEIENGTRIVREKTELIPDAELAELRRQRDALLEVHKQMFPPPKATTEQKLAAKRKSLERAISDIEAQIQSRDVAPKGKPEPLTSPEIEALQSRLRELKEQREALREEMGITRQQEIERTSRALDRAIEGLLQELDEGPKLKERPQRVSTPELDAKRSRLEELRAIRDAILKPERDRKLYEASLRRRIAQYESKIARKEFAPEPKKEPRKLSQAELDLQRQLANIKHDFFEKVAEYQRANFTTREKARDIARETAHLSRAIMTSIDFSAVLRQGGLGAYGHPELARQAAGEMWAATWSRQREFESMERLRNDPMVQFGMQAGLAITENEGQLQRQEEAFMGRWVRNGIDVAGPRVQAASAIALEPVAASARAYVTHLNNFRALLFKQMVDNLGRSGEVTLDEAKVIANYINVVTGRGDIKLFGRNFNHVATELNTVFFAPRYVASRFQYMTFLLTMQGEGATGRVRKAIAMEYARTFAGAATFLTTAVALGSLLAGDDDDKPTVELDPRSSDFLKLRIGDTRIDPMAGLSQAMVLSARMLPRALGGAARKSTITGEVTPFGEGYKAENRATVGLSFLRTKMAPIPGAAWTMLDDWTNVVGEEETPMTMAASLFVPLSVQEILSPTTMRQRGLTQQAALAMLAALGMGMNTYGPKTEYLDASPEERKEMVTSYIKHMDWDSDLPQYSEYLSSEDIERIQRRQEQRRADLVYRAAGIIPFREDYETEEGYEEATAKLIRAREQFAEFRTTYAPSLGDALRYLYRYYDDKGGVYRRGSTTYKPSFVERRDMLYRLYSE